ncbi:enoyl-CoA hydratase/isomerase domain-containing protein [Ditylenchus destructor]|uniref:Delta(3,5)-Delta(2,4)-dienoyl-CoA isomerase, mitochondrial n=1 Tax=Ditylenchus destructor TaxID=166010 RepID=A0AAD4R3G4_9BILA|nr:enoyl-CoA hydratase/isomerase domain-containing protein [Ditylenchus destructor]
MLLPRLARFPLRNFRFPRQYSTGSQDILVSDKSNGVFHVQLNRPDTRNAFTLELWDELGSTFNRLSDDSKCRSIVLSGSGKSFCAGIDLKSGLTGLIGIISDDNMDGARKARALRKIIKICQDGYTAIEKCSKPVIASVHSHCFGAGISLVGCCDIRYCSNDTRFSIKEVDIGLAADVGILQRIEKITGNSSFSREIAYTAREVSSAEALNFGLVSKVFSTQEECLAACVELAELIASKSPVAVQGSKLALNYARSHGVDDALEFMLTWNQSQLQTEDLMRNATAKMTKTKPEFNDV